MDEHDGPYFLFECMQIYENGSKDAFAFMAWKIFAVDDF